jgi:hypothetical protein
MVTMDMIVLCGVTQCSLVVILYFSIPLHDIFNIQYISPSLLELS